MIYLALLRNPGGEGWGYKDMTEQMGPYYYSVPLSFLDAVPLSELGDAPGCAEEWRDKVRENAAARNVGRQLRIGATYLLQNVSDEWEDRKLTITSLRPLRGTVGHLNVRFKKKQLGKEVH